MYALALYILYAIGFAVGAIVALIIPNRDGCFLLIVRVTVFGIIGAFMAPYILGAFNDFRESLAENKRNEIARNEIDYFERTISGEIDNKEYLGHYENNTISYYGKNKIYKFDFENKLKTSPLKEQEIKELINKLGKYPEIISELIFHPKVSEEYRLDKLNDLLDTINNKDYFSFIRFLTSNNKVPQEVLAKIASRARLFYVEEMIKDNTNCPEVAKTIYDIREGYNRSDAQRQKKPTSWDYKNPDSKKAWDFLIGDTHEYVRIMVARHPSAPPEALALLAHDTSNDVLCWLLLNKNTTDNTKARISSFTGMSNDEYLYIIASLDDRNEWKLRAIAKHSDYYQATIERLANDKYNIVRKAVAERDDLPNARYTQLANDVEFRVREAVAENANTPDEIIELLSHDSSEPVRKAVAERPNSPSDVLELLSTDNNQAVLSAVAKNPSTPREALEKLRSEIASKWPQDQWAKNTKNVISNNLIANEVLDESQVRELVYEQRHCPECVSYLLLKNDISEKYRVEKLDELVGELRNLDNVMFVKSLTRDEKTPPEILTKLATRAPLKLIDDLIADNNPRCPEFAKIIYLIRLDFNRSEAQRKNEPIFWGHNNPNYKKAWDFLIGDTHDVRLMVAKHPSVPPEVLDLLTQDHSGDILFWTFINKNSTEKIKNQILSLTSMTVEEFLYTHAVDDGKQDPRYYGYDSFSLMSEKRKAIAQLNKLSQRTLESLAKYEQLWIVREQVARRSDLPDELYLFMASDPASRVRAALVLNPNVPVSVIELLGHDSNDYIRKEVAGNPKAPIELLELLSNDQSRVVLSEIASNPSTPRAALEQLRKTVSNKWPKDYVTRETMENISSNLRSR